MDFPEEGRAAGPFDAAEEIRLDGPNASTGEPASHALTGVLPTRGENLGQVLVVLFAGSIARVRDLAPAVPSEVGNLVDDPSLNRGPARTQRMRDRVVVAQLGRVAAKLS